MLIADRNLKMKRVNLILRAY